jgi:hypothetical protein
MANKTFWKGQWREIELPNPLDPKGRLGGPCAPLVPGEDVKWVAEGAYGASGNFLPEVQAVRAMPPSPEPGDRTYRVVTPDDPWFDGKFSPRRLEERLNEMGREGWRAVGITGTRHDPVVLLERTVDAGNLAGAAPGRPPS